MEALTGTVVGEEAVAGAEGHPWTALTDLEGVDAATGAARLEVEGRKKFRFTLNNRYFHKSGLNIVKLLCRHKL